MKQLATFDDDWLAGFREKSGVTDAAALSALRDELFTIGQHYRRIIETTPCDLIGNPFNRTLTQRGDWVNVNVVRPTEKLLAALGESNRPWFSTWPYEHEFEEFPDRDRLRADLQKVLEFSQLLLRNIRGEQKADVATNQELRFYIFKDIVSAVRRHLPGLTPKRGVYQRLVDEKTKRFVGRFPEAIRYIYAEITGINEQLVRLARAVVDDPDWDY